MTYKNRRTAAVSVLAAGLLLPGAAAAQDFKPQGYAASTGISLNPDQFHGGVRFQIGSRLQPQIRPVVDVGFGNGVRLFSFGVDALYHFGGTRWRPYAGAGPGLNVIDVTDGVGESDGMTTKLPAPASGARTSRAGTRTSRPASSIGSQPRPRGCWRACRSSTRATRSRRRSAVRATSSFASSRRSP